MSQTAKILVAILAIVVGVLGGAWFVTSTGVSMEVPERWMDDLAYGEVLSSWTPYRGTSVYREDGLLVFVYRFRWLTHVLCWVLGAGAVLGGIAFIRDEDGVLDKLLGLFLIVCAVTVLLLPTWAARRTLSADTLTVHSGVFWGTVPLREQVLRDPTHVWTVEREHCTDDGCSWWVELRLAGDEGELEVMRLHLAGLGRRAYNERQHAAAERIAKGLVAFCGAELGPPEPRDL